MVYIQHQIKMRFVQSSLGLSISYHHLWDLRCVERQFHVQRKNVVVFFDFPKVLHRRYRSIRLTSEIS